MTHSPELSYTIETVSTAAELESAFKQGLIDLYKSVFSEPPYEESFDDEQVTHIFETLFLQGMVLLAREHTDAVIGFCASLPLVLEREIALLAADFDIQVEKAWYFAELGVALTHRRKGIAQQLVLSLIENTPSPTLVMRTASENIASQQVNAGVGFQVIPGMEQTVVQERTNGTVAEDIRIFLRHDKK